MGDRDLHKEEEHSVFDVADNVRYERLTELGRGGMGQVTIAHDRRLHRQVALKEIIRSHGTPNQDPQEDQERQEALARRLEREARITAALDHPAIVPIFDAGRLPEGTPYYTMRIIRGRTLSVKMEEAASLSGRLALLRHFLAACEATAYAHNQGVVHRDLKPDNILVGEFGETQVADWGLAESLDPEPGEEQISSRQIVGTSGYMSPEQSQGAPADPRSDVYSLGKVLQDILGSYQGVPSELRSISDRATTEDPQGRYPNASELAADLERYLNGAPVHAHRYSLFDLLLRWIRLHRQGFRAWVIALLLLFSIGTVAFFRTRADRDRARHAETQALQALAQADKNLALALVEQARSAQAMDAQAEAEVLAAYSLTLSESPEARGVLAAYGRSGRPSRRSESPLPDCEALRLRKDGAILCLIQEELSLYEGFPPRQRWSARVPARDMVWIGDDVFVSTSTARGILFSGKTGAKILEVGTLSGPWGFVQTQVSDLAILMNPNGLSFYSRKENSLKIVTPCGQKGGEHLAATANASGSLVALACRNGRVLLLDSKGAELKSFSPTSWPLGPSSLGLSADGQELLVGLLNGEVWTYSIKDPVTERGRRQPNLGILRRMINSEDGKRVLLLGDRGAVGLWQRDPGTLVQRLPAMGLREAVFASQRGADPNTEMILVAGRSLVAWDVPPGPPGRILDPLPPGLAGAALSSDGRRLAAAMGDGRLAVFDTATGALLFGDRYQDGVLKGATFLPDGGLLTWAAGHPSVRRYDQAGNPTLTKDFGILLRAAQLRLGWLVILDYGQGAKLYDPRGTKEPIRIGERLFVDCSASAAGDVVLLLDEAGEVWAVHDGDPPLAKKLFSRRSAIAVAVSGDGALVALADREGGEVRTRAEGKIVGTFQGKGRRILDLALSQDGTLVAAADLDRSARVWSTKEGRLLALLGGHESRVAGVAFGKGPLLATASWDGSARLWDLSILGIPATKLRTAIEADWGLDFNTALQFH